MTTRSTVLARAGGILGAGLAAMMLVACTADGPSLEASATPSAQDTPRPDLEKPADPSKVPGLETAPPVIPTNEPGRQDSVLDSLPGKSKPGCVDVGDQRDVRSGSMAAGNFADARAHFSGSPTSSIPFYFIPVDATGDPELVVQLKRLDGSGSDEVRSSRTETADEWLYYPVQIRIPSAGSWQIKASAGSASEGCWVVAFKS